MRIRRAFLRSRARSIRSAKSPRRCSDLFRADDLRGEARKRLHVLFEREVEVANANGAEPLCAAAADERKAAFVGFVRGLRLCNLGIDHGSCSAVVHEDDDSFALPDHIGRQAYAFMRVGCQGMQVGGDGESAGVA